ncbi:MAG: FAD-dependent oxidoreductase [Candidatus Thermoplasmatota archaeon]|nr:FAD-binding protein [Euryarchaeota archaeon]MBU4032058.1 FAD-dependent oxidoreductase [Candidatus Thermoplasmatota archaeon]MBU4071683.1 FAD-dependent oxidoreductase [Candidatus Thermoplasmatota archaeon]MBU4145055.1 FAD-dependent oxidoreductase [Candidatus Thermoplasmatota archaeon]MBU4591989.1 FAD-dependent oxidoreductase [Candidatus Thermoplasmatota archaeon]
MTDRRITQHPILATGEKATVNFTFNGKSYKAMSGEPVSSAMMAHGINVFNTHHKDGAPQGIFCANGQCAQCLVLVNGNPKKACITTVEEGMNVRSIEGLPELTADDVLPESKPISVIETDVLIVGAGPAGMAAATELAVANLKIIIADDKEVMGGKLGLQTHNFFGSVRDCNAGMRGMDIGTLMAEEIEELDNVDVWLNAPVVGVFSDGLVGVQKGKRYVLVRPKHFLVTAGAREKTLAFPGCDLPGVYGGGAFQTLVNRDLIKASNRLFIVGGGNVGLIAAYHAMQAGIEVLGLVEALPKCGGYKVHLDKIKRLGIPVWTSHTVLKAEGNCKLERITISEIGSNFQPIPGTEKTFEDVDTLLVAVGLAPVNELLLKAKEYGMSVYAAGDANVIAEASAAIFSGHIIGKKMLRDLGHDVDIPKEWFDILEMLRAKPGPTHDLETLHPKKSNIFPIIRCTQEIPCNPCTAVCPKDSIRTSNGRMTGIPQLVGECIGCTRCVAICPGLAITLVDTGYDPTGKTALVTIPWELPAGSVEPEQEVRTRGFEGEEIGTGKVIAMRNSGWQNRRVLLMLEVPMQEAEKVAGIRMYSARTPTTGKPATAGDDDDTIVCRCERVTKGEIISYIKEHNTTDFNALKAGLRVGMGACGGKTCTELVMRIFKQVLGRDAVIEPHVERPFTQEVPLSAFIDGGG